MREAQKAGIVAAQIALVQELAARDKGTTAIARATGLSRQTVIRIRQSPGEALARLGRWNQSNVPIM